jgi:effector-binding domain-containing protein
MMNKVIQDGYQMADVLLDIYFNSPLEVSESELLTELQFPVVQI